MSLYQHARDGNAERLRDAMGSDSAAVRKRAAEFLGEVADHGDQPSIDVLLRAATGDEDAQVRGGAVDALDEIGEAALEQLLSELTGTKGSEAEWVTARKFARALQADRPELRMAAANALSADSTTGAVSSTSSRRSTTRTPASGSGRGPAGPSPIRVQSPG